MVRHALRHFIDGGLRVDIPGALTSSMPGHGSPKQSNPSTNRLPVPNRRYFSESLYFRWAMSGDVETAMVAGSGTGRARAFIDSWIDQLGCAVDA